MKQLASPSDLRLVHGVAFVVLTTVTLSVRGLRQWPWVWLAPLVAFFVLVACIPPIRRPLGWLRLGRLSAATVAATMGIMVLASSALFIFHSAARPEVRSYRNYLPLDAFGNVVAAGVIFTIVNATLEELIFRGVLFDAVRSQCGMWSTLIGTAMLFGLGHLHGYPPGPLGVCLAALFGFAMGALRLWTGGLLLPIVAHMGADATIYSILVG